MTDAGMLVIAAAIERGIVGQANFVAGLTTAIFGGMVALRVQFMLYGKEGPILRWSWGFWGATLFMLPTVGLAFAISGLLIEIAPILFSHRFDIAKEFSQQNFCGTRIGKLEEFSLVQMLTFIVFVVLSGVFVLRNVVQKTK